MIFIELRNKGKLAVKNNFIELIPGSKSNFKFDKPLFKFF